MISIFAWFGYTVPMRERFPMIRQAGFEGVTFWWEGAGDFKSDNLRNPLAYKEQPALARKAGLFVENIHAPFGSANALWQDSEEGAAYAQVLLNCLEDCAAYEIPAMVMHPCSGKNVPLVSEIGLRRFDALAARAQQLGVTIAMENLIAAGPLERAALLLERYDSPHFGFCYDSGHRHVQLCAAPETDTPANNLLARFGHRLQALHLHDNDGSDDQHHLPFDGSIDWSAVMQSIKAAGYRGSTHLEVHIGHEDMPAEDYLVQAYERAKKLEELQA